MGNVSRNVTDAGIRRTVKEQDEALRAEKQARVADMTPGEKRRYAELLSSSGLNSRRVAIEILYLLPPTFVKAYEDLFHDAVLLGDEGSGQKADRDAELGRAKGGSRQGSRRGSSVFPIRNAERARQKDWVDRQLRKLARGITTGEAGLGKRLKCGDYKRGQKLRAGEKESKGCGKFVEDDWRHCAGCGRQAQPERVQSSE